MYLLVFLYIANLFIAASVISDSFRSFLQVSYGTDTAEIIARDDMGIIGSFGGGNHTSGTKTKYAVASDAVHSAWLLASNLLLNSIESVLSYSFTE